MSLDQKRAVFGVLSLIIFVTSIPALGLYCMLKGFRPLSPIFQGGAREDRPVVPAVAPA